MACGSDSGCDSCSSGGIGASACEGRRLPGGVLTKLRGTRWPGNARARGGVFDTLRVKGDEARRCGYDRRAVEVNRPRVRSGCTCDGCIVLAIGGSAYRGLPVVYSPARSLARKIGGLGKGPMWRPLVPGRVGSLLKLGGAVDEALFPDRGVLFARLAESMGTHTAGDLLGLLRAGDLLAEHSGDDTDSRRDGVSSGGFARPGESTPFPERQRKAKDHWAALSRDVLSGGLGEEPLEHLMEDEDDAPILYISGAACPAAYSDEGFYCAKDSGELGGQEVEEGNRDVLDRAYDLINDHLDNVEDWLDAFKPSHSDCMADRLSGGSSSTSASLIRETEYSKSWNATNAWGSRYMLFAGNYLNGVTNSFEDEARSDDQERCIALALARTIVHETMHSCWRTSEETAHIIAYFFARRVASAESITTEEWCCVPTDLDDGFDPDSYSGSDDVFDAGDYWPQPEDRDGTWFLLNTC